MTRGMSGGKGRGGHGKGGGGGDGKERGEVIEMGRTGRNGKGREMGGGGGQHSAIVQFESLVQQFISASDIHRL